MLSISQYVYVHTGPPTAARNLQVTHSTSTNITVQWDPPVRTGRPDYYYVIEYSDPDDASIYNRHNKDDVKGTRYTLDNLRADTIYIIQVSVHNGVSDQDSENADERIVQINARTMEGRKYTVSITCYVFNITVTRIGRGGDVY